MGGKARKKYFTEYNGDEHYKKIMKIYGKNFQSKNNDM